MLRFLLFLLILLFLLCHVHHQYSVSYSQLMTRSLLISVWHHGRLKRNTFLGEVEIPLDSRNLDSLLIERMALMSKVHSLTSRLKNNTVLKEKVKGYSLLFAVFFLLRRCISCMWCPFSWQASVSSTSTFSQYKGELVISLKYVTPQKTAAEKTKGETLRNLELWSGRFLTFCLVSTQQKNLCLWTEESCTSWLRRQITWSPWKLQGYQTPSWKGWT